MHMSVLLNTLAAIFCDVLKVTELFKGTKLLLNKGVLLRHEFIACKPGS